MRPAAHARAPRLIFNTIVPYPHFENMDLDENLVTTISSVAILQDIDRFVDLTLQLNFGDYFNKITALEIMAKAAHRFQDADRMDRAKKQGADSVNRCGQELKIQKKAVSEFQAYDRKYDKKKERMTLFP